MGAIHKHSLNANSPIWSYPTVLLSHYSTDASAGITKQVLVGINEGAADFIIRYFIIPPRGKSAFDQHRHQHGVVITHGTGKVLLGKNWHEIGVGDTVFIDTDEIHQLEATGGGPLGFICVIPRWAESDSCAVPIK
jgi:quercetin dioxygenase-like cupin family protein